jgi:hypothetical protein
MNHLQKILPVRKVPAGEFFNYEPMGKNLSRGE